MIRWLLIVVLALLLCQGLLLWLRRFGFGRLPGDFVFRAFGREWQLPLASTLLLSIVASAIARWIA